MPKTKDKPSVPFEPSYSIREFCAAEGISGPTFYKLRALGQGPKEMRLGTAVRISHRARLEWQESRQNLSAAEAKTVRAYDEARRQQALDAVEHTARIRRRA